MPKISRFLGIKIFMYFNEHKASVNIQTFGVIEGRLPAKVLGLVVERAEDCQDDLLQNWNDLKNTEEWN